MPKPYTVNTRKWVKHTYTKRKGLQLLQSNGTSYLSKVGSGFDSLIMVGDHAFSILISVRLTWVSTGKENATCVLEAFFNFFYIT